jgi:predicted RNA-binding Zn ribbon-like protein
MSTTDNLLTVRIQIVVPRRDLGIDFANTVAYRGSKPEDSLHNLADLFTWLRTAKALPEPLVATLPRLIASAQIDETLLFNEIISLRETGYRLLNAVAAPSAMPSGDLQRLNHAMAEAPARVSLAHSDSLLGWRIETQPTAAGILAPVLWSTADLLAGPDSARLRACANPQCLWLFLDDSKNGTRRWCSMQACGNRAKAHRHYQRQKEK